MGECYSVGEFFAYKGRGRKEGKEGMGEDGVFWLAGVWLVGLIMLHFELLIK